MTLHPEAIEAARREALKAPSKLSANQLRLLRSNGCPIGRPAGERQAS